MSRTAKSAEARKDKIKIQQDLISERSKVLHQTHPTSSLRFTRLDHFPGPLTV
jgi:hypothetical protein